MLKAFPISAQKLGTGQPIGGAQGSHYTSRLLLAVLALIVAARLSVAHLLENRFHQDEALYATFARYVASGPGHGLLLSHLLVDKPPLAFYLNGLSVFLLGPSEFALRLPSFLASLISVALVYAIGRRLFGAPAGLAAAWVMALSPFAILFSITVFVDPLLTTWILLAIWLLVRGRPGWGAVALALAWATKQTALLFVPLALLLGLAGLPRPVRWRPALAFLVRAAALTLTGVILVTALVIAWDRLRGAPISLYQQGYSDNVSARLATAAELQPRAVAMLTFLHYFTGNDLISLLFLAGLMGVLAYDLSGGDRAHWVDALLVIYVSGYLAGYWLVSLNLFDRYFLPIVPLWALLAGRVLDLSGRAAAAGLVAVGRRTGFTVARLRPAATLVTRVVVPVACLLIAIPIGAAANYDFSPIGGDHGAYDGMDDAARFVTSLPHNSVLYDHWLNWEFDYYLFDRPVHSFYYPTARDLTQDLLAHGRQSPRFLIVPAWAHDLDPIPAVRQAGFNPRLAHQSFRRDGIVSLTIYQLAAAP